MRSIANRGHALVESISAPAGVDVLSSVLRKESILGSMMSSNSCRAAIDLHIDLAGHRFQVDLNFDWQSSSDRRQSN
ncbi:hypothetical protein KEM48_006063 [Puccinia striiformis f. sp. tritici PST-130]|nr:hypothetical protein KEM48_006063 [Puccinia striiformis f. sp. tritici PST-130]